MYDAPSPIQWALHVQAHNPRLILVCRGMLNHFFFRIQNRMEHFHSLKPVVMPRGDYINEHQRLVKALESQDPGLLKAELKEQKGDLAKGMKGGGIKEDKRYINSKTAWSLAHLEMKVLKEFYDNPAVPPSMKMKLKEAMMVKPTLKKKLKGGLTGVSKASGFIRRLMWENSHKHNGSYGNPTWGLAADSKMKKAAKFEYKKLASASQGGLNDDDYGASPFITHHFATTARKAKSKTSPESDAQKAARAKFKKRGAPKEAVETSESGTPVPTHPGLLEHFANQTMMGEPPVGIEVRPVTPPPEEEAEAAPPAPKPKAKGDILGSGVFKNKVWTKPCAFWLKFTAKYASGREFVSKNKPFQRLTYESGGFWRSMFADSPMDHAYEKKPVYGAFLKHFYGINDFTERHLTAYKGVEFYVPNLPDAEWEKKRAELNEKKNLMGVSYCLWRVGKLIDKGWSVTIADCPMEVYVDGKKPYWTVTRGDRMILISPTGHGWEMGALFDRDYPVSPSYGGLSFVNVIKKDGRWELDKDAKTGDENDPRVALKMEYSGKDADADEAYKMAEGVKVDEAATYIRLTDGSDEASVILDYMKKARAESEAAAKKKPPK